MSLGDVRHQKTAQADNALMRLASLSVRLADGEDSTGLNLRGELPALVCAAGFEDVVESGRQMTVFGTLMFLRGRVAA
jgi:hypothetical protein